MPDANAVAALIWVLWWWRKEEVAGRRLGGQAPPAVVRMDECSFVLVWAAPVCYLLGFHRCQLSAQGACLRVEHGCLPEGGVGIAPVQPIDFRLDLGEFLGQAAQLLMKRLADAGF